MWSYYLSHPSSTSPVDENSHSANSESLLSPDLLPPSYRSELPLSISTSPLSPIFPFYSLSMLLYWVRFYFTPNYEYYFTPIFPFSPLRVYTLQKVIILSPIVCSSPQVMILCEQIYVSVQAFFFLHTCRKVHLEYLAFQHIVLATIESRFR